MATQRSHESRLGLTFLAALPLAAILGCASSVEPAPAAPAIAQLEVSQLAPAAGSSLSRSTIISAVVRYSIIGFDARDSYYLVPLFASTKGSETFNALPSARAGILLNAHEGSVNVRYPIAGEWDSARLARPIILRFAILAPTGEHRSKGIGQTAPITFPAPE